MVGIGAWVAGAVDSEAVVRGPIAIVDGGVVVVVTSKVRLGIGGVVDSVFPVMVLQAASATALSPTAMAAIAPRKGSRSGGP